VQEALNLGHNYVGTEHILLALVAKPDGFATTLLTELKVDVTTVRPTVTGQLAEHVKKK
jgi:ATP-dependent Clp protease ATP-binding subunit ClpC